MQFSEYLSQFVVLDSEGRHGTGKSRPTLKNLAKQDVFE